MKQMKASDKNDCRYSQAFRSAHCSSFLLIAGTAPEGQLSQSNVIVVSINQTLLIGIRFHTIISFMF